MSGDCQEFGRWLRELRIALEFGDAATVGSVGALVAQKSAKKATFVLDVPMDGPENFFLMRVVIDQTEAQRRSTQITQTDGVMCEKTGTQCIFCDLHLRKLLTKIVINAEKCMRRTDGS